MKKTILVAGVLMVASMVQAEILEWRVDLGGANSTFSTAQLFATSKNDETFLIGATDRSGKINTYETYGVINYASTLTVSDINNYFYVKLENSVGGLVGYSALKSWSTLVSEGALVSGYTPDLPATAWNAVPEPTAMALLAMGLSALLLRRKRTV